MALSFLSGTGNASHAKYFDIRLDEPYVVFRGSPDEAASAHLKGSLVLCLSEPLSIKHVKLHLIGMSRVSWTVVTGPLTASKKVSKEQVIFDKAWKFRDAGKGKTEILAADNYEFPFDIVLPGTLPESVEGMHETFVTYRFKAEIGRKYSKNIVTRKPLRIIRTLDPSALELAHVMSVENVWPNKLEYSISIPSKAVIFGTSVPVNFRLVSLLKGLRIGNVTTQLIESHELCMNPNDPTPHITSKSSRTIFTDTFELNEDEDLQILDEEAEGYRISRAIDLPKTLRRCVQDTDAKGIKIRHKLKFKVQLHNPDGHMSELRATLPIHIFLSPNLPLDENNNLVDQGHQSSQMTDFYLAQQAPPLYSEHQFDQLFGELDAHGYFTPANYSGPGSPLQPLSRNMSSENLALPNAGTEVVCATALHHRLRDLHVNSSTSTHPSHEGAEQSGNAAHRHSPIADHHPLSAEVQQDDNSSDSSRRGSEEAHLPSGMGTPRVQYSEIEDLCRVPSYSTAVRSTARTQFDKNLPNYEAVVASDLTSRLPIPQQAHTRRPGTSQEASSRPNFSLHHRAISHSHEQDTERQIRIMQARSRA